MLGRWMTVAAAAAGLLLAGCGDVSGEDLCETACDCEGDSCDDGDLEECIDEFDDEEADAEAAGCEDEYQEVLDCYDEEGTCKDGHYEWGDDDACQDVGRAYSDCVDD